MAVRCWLLIGWLMVASGVWANPPLIIAGTPEPPFKMQENGEITGIDVEIMRSVLKELGIAHEFRLIDSGARLMRDAREGRVDVILSLSRRDDRETFLEYPARSYKSVQWHFFARADEAPGIVFERYEDIRHLRVGAVNEWAYSADFWSSGLNIERVSNHGLLIPMLLSKRIDIAPMNTLETLYYLRSEGLSGKITYLPRAIASRPYYNVFSRASNKPGLRELARYYDQSVAKLEGQGEVASVFVEYLGVDVATR